MKRKNWLMLTLSLLLVGAVSAATVTDWNPDVLNSYEVDTLRARRIEILDDAGNIRLVLTVHKDKSAVSAYDAAGNAEMLHTVEF